MLSKTLPAYNIQVSANQLDPKYLPIQQGDADVQQMDQNSLMSQPLYYKLLNAVCTRISTQLLKHA